MLSWLGCFVVILIGCVVAALCYLCGKRCQNKGDPAMHAVLQKAMEQDSDLKAMMEDVRLHGPAAADKYLANAELMIKMGRLSGGGFPTRPGQGNTAAARKVEGGSVTCDPKQELRRRRQQLARQKAAEEKKVAKQEEQHAREDAEAWEAMQQEMQTIGDKR
mmetsp:Transcript_94797/g.187799  ORF Transcript_94797/g.187799 Transcript_94797/m.187799 type:complete len:162 (+) Transcript_94797:76-561(+)